MVKLSLYFIVFSTLMLYLKGNDILYLGCFADYDSQRDLTGPNYTSNQMTINMCFSNCNYTEYSLIGLQNG